LIDKADAVVIGGGIMGASTAHHLTKLGFGQVVLLEKGQLAAGATGYSAANVRQHYSNEVTIRLAVRAVEMFENSEDEFGGETGFVQCGYMVITPPEQEQAIRTIVPVQQSLGVKTDLISSDEIAELYPTLDLDGIKLGCLETNSGYANPVQTVKTLVATAKRKGLNVFEGCQVVDIKVEGDAVRGVVTSEGPIATPIVVNAAGPWADRIGAMAGIGYKLRFSREHEAVFATGDTLGPLPVVADAAQRIFFRPQGRDQLLVGESYPKELEPCDPETYSDNADDEVVDRMVSRLVRRLPALASDLSKHGYGGKLDHSYSGVYSITDDWYPIVGNEPGLHGYYAAIGGSGHGFKIGPPIGESLAAVIAGNEPPVDISPLAHARFAEGRGFSSVWGSGNRG
jgi:sarcosine oxidase subunit beta